MEDSSEGEQFVEGKHDGYLSALRVAIIYFLMLNRTDYRTARSETQKVIKGFKIVDLTETLIHKSFREDRIEDLEDAVQFHSAKEVAEVFITRNKRHFRAVEDEIEILTPEEFLEKYQS